MAFGIACAIGVTIWAVCTASTNWDPIIIGFTAGMGGSVTSVTWYVITSESHCHIEALFGHNETQTHPYMGDVDENLG